MGAVPIAVIGSPSEGMLAAVTQDAGIAPPVPTVGPVPGNSKPVCNTLAIKLSPLKLLRLNL
jgi:hypothetical protein